MKFTVGDWRTFGNYYEFNPVCKDHNCYLTNQHVLLQHIVGHGYSSWAEVLKKEDRVILEKVRGYIWKFKGDKLSESQKEK